MQTERDVFKELAEAAPFLSFTTDFLILNGLAPEADVSYYCVCKSDYLGHFKDFFDSLSQNRRDYPVLL